MSQNNDLTRFAKFIEEMLIVGNDLPDDLETEALPGGVVIDNISALGEQVLLDLSNGRTLVLNLSIT